MTKTKTAPDVIVDQHDSIAGLVPLTQAGRCWIDANCQAESWMWLGGALNIDCRCAVDIVGGMRNAGLLVQDQR